MILMLRTENMGHITPYFFDYSDENAFASADRFTSLMLGEPLGIRGRIFSMGDKFDGKIKITLADHSIKEIIGEKFSVSTGKTVDWWETKANTNAVYDTVHFSDIWNVYRYHFS